MIEALLTLDPSPLDIARAPDRRVIGTCRHFALLSCALLRYRGVAARVRYGFATYFQAGQGLDHWITEYWHEKDGRWGADRSRITIGGTGCAFLSLYSRRSDNARIRT